MTLESAITFFIVIFIFSITPGPGIFALLARALTSGAWACTSLALGMTISDVIYLILACFGLAVIAEQWSWLFTIIRFGGAGYLLYLGWKMWTTPVQGEASNERLNDDGYTMSKGLLQGFLISASNPKVIIFYIAFLPTIMDVTVLSHTDIILASGLTIVSLMSGLMLVVICASSARKFFTSSKGAKRLNRTAGGIMMGAGGYLGLHG